jgi:hypothetical protein
MGILVAFKSKVIWNKHLPVGISIRVNTPSTREEYKLLDYMAFATYN